MQSILHLSATYGLPLSVYGINYHLSNLAKQIADHDLRRESMKKQRSMAGEGVREIEAERTFERVLREIIEVENDGDLASELQDLIYNSIWNCTAKAA